MYDRDTLNRLYRYCRAFCDQESDAFDLLQTALERCVRTPPRDPAAKVAYAMRTIRNTFIDQIRSNARITFEPIEENSVTLEFDLASLEDTMLDHDEIEQAWSEMTIIEREILYLWAVEGYSTTEVATHLEKPRNTVLSIIHRMRQRLRRRFDKERTAG